jgi:hypothetical protein
MGTRRVRLTSITALPRKTQTQWKQRDIRSPGFMDAALTVEWLNACKGTVAYRRVLALRTELETLRAEFDKPFPGIEWETAKRPTEKSANDLQRQNEYIERHRQLNLLLAKYSFKTEIAYNFSAHRWWLTVIPKNSRGPQIEIENEAEFFKIRVTEPWVVAALTRLATNRDLSSVHLCKNCQERWHVSLRSIDQFCRKECREHFHTHSDAYRERKRQAQKDYRKNIRENEIRQENFRSSQKGLRSNGERKG